MTQSSYLPATTTRAQALAMLSDHEFFLSCNPHMDKYEPIPATGVNPPPSVPDTVKAQLRSSSSSSSASAPSSEHELGDDRPAGGEPVPACYRVTDIVYAVPAGIWGTCVVSTYEFTDIRDGMFVRIRGPLSVIMDTFWEIREVVTDGGDGDSGPRLELVEDMTIQCSRLLVGIIKGQCEQGWEGIHQKMIARLEGEAQERERLGGV